MRIVGIAGAARSGKDTIASWLVDQRGAAVYSFAMPIKLGICFMFGLPDTIWESPAKELPIEGLGKSPRELAQTLGTEWGRNLVNQDVWLFAARRALERGGHIDDLADLLVIPDVRFANEARFVRDNGVLLHVYRDGANGEVGVVGHESERGVEYRDRDVMISNNGTIAELNNKLAWIFPGDPSR